MPTIYTNDYQVAGWTSGNFTGPLTGGSADFYFSTGVVFRPSGETGGTGVVTWIDGLGADELTVNVSCQTPTTSSTGGWVGLVDETFTAIVGQSTDMSGGGTKTVVLDTSGVDWTTVRGIQVKSGDASQEHEFTLHSSTFTSPSAALTVSGSVPLGGYATLFEACMLTATGSIPLGGAATLLSDVNLSVSGNVPLGGAASIVMIPTLSVHDGYFFGGGAVFDTPVDLTVSGRLPLFGAANFYGDPALVASGKIKIIGGATLLSSATLSANGKFKLGGTGVFNIGGKLSASGKVSLGGLATSYSGRALSASGKITLYGAAQFKHAVSIDVHGHVPFYGIATFWHAAPSSLHVSVAIPLSGSAAFAQARLDISDFEAYVITRQKEVVTRG